MPDYAVIVDANEFALQYIHMLLALHSSDTLHFRPCTPSLASSLNVCVQTCSDCQLARTNYYFLILHISTITSLKKQPALRWKATVATGYSLENVAEKMDTASRNMLGLSDNLPRNS